MRAAGVRRVGGPIELLELPEPRALRPDEVLIDVRAAGVANWDDIARSGGWDVGAHPPAALGVEASGTVAAVGSQVDTALIGAPVATHSVPFREHGAWAEQFIAPAADTAPVPAGLTLEVAAVLPVPALTADQTLDRLDVGADDVVLVNGAGGVTGRLLVQLASRRGARVLATASAGRAAELSDLGAAHVLDYLDPGWPAAVRSLLAGRGVDAAVNAAPGGAQAALDATRDGGRLGTITSDPPEPERGISVTTVYVSPDGARLGRLLQLAASGELAVAVGATYPLAAAATALDRALAGGGGRGVAVLP